MKVSAAWSWLKAAGKYLLLALILHWAGGLDWRASLVISLFLPVETLFSSRSRAESAKAQIFYPYEIHLRPKVGWMLIQLGLLTDERWKKLRDGERTEETEQAWRFARDGALGTSIGLDNDMSEIVYWWPHQMFRSGKSYTIPLNFITMDYSFIPSHPEYFFLSKGDGYHQGIEVTADWWDEHEDRLTKSGIVKHVDDERVLYGRVKLTLSILPSEATWPYFMEWNPQLDATTDLKAKEKGWARLDYGGDYGPRRDAFRNEYGEVILYHLPSMR